MSAINWIKRRFWNKKAREAATAQAKDLLVPTSPQPDSTRAERRGWIFRTKAGRKWRKGVIEVQRSILRERRGNYPVLAHCIIGACRRLPRYAGMCYRHKLEALRG